MLVLALGILTNKLYYSITFSLYMSASIGIARADILV